MPFEIVKESCRMELGESGGAMIYKIENGKREAFACHVNEASAADAIAAIEAAEEGKMDEEPMEEEIKFSLMDIVRWAFDGEEGIGAIEDIDEESGTYTVRVYAMAADELVETDRIIEVPAEALADYFEAMSNDLEELGRMMEEEAKAEIEIDLGDDSEEEEVEEKAEDISVGEFVEWDSARGTAQGRIEDVKTEGTIEVPDTDFTIEAKEDDPAALIEVYERVEGGWKPSGVMVGHLASELRKIDPLDVIDVNEKRQKSRIIAKMKNASMDVQKDEEGNMIGIIEAKLSAFGGVDVGGDTVDKNAYNQTVKQKGQIPMLLDHEYDTKNYIGTWYLSIGEDGLYGKGEMPLESQSAKEAYIKMKFSLKSGDPLGVSIGYDPIKAEPGPNGTRILKEIALHEASVTPFPMDLQARIMDAKSKKLSILKKQQEWQTVIPKKSKPPTSTSLPQDALFALLDDLNNLVNSFRSL